MRLFSIGITWYAWAASKIKNIFDDPISVNIAEILGVGYKSSIVNLLTWRKSTVKSQSSLWDQTQVTKVRNFPRFSNRGDFLWRISKKFLENHSSEILEKIFRIGPQDERFLWDHSFETQFQKFLRNSPEIPEKFLGLGYHVYRFLEEFMKRISFVKFLWVSLEFHP